MAAYIWSLLWNFLFCSTTLSGPNIQKLHSAKCRLCGGCGSASYPNLVSQCPTSFWHHESGHYVKAGLYLFFPPLHFMALCCFQMRVVWNRWSLMYLVPCNGKLCYSWPRTKYNFASCYLCLEFIHWWSWLFPFHPWTSSRIWFIMVNPGSITRQSICKKFLPISLGVLLTILSFCSCVCSFGTHNKQIFYTIPLITVYLCVSSCIVTQLSATIEFSIEC
jgi:hypothetical protein